MERGTGNKKHKWQVQTRQERIRIVWEMEKPKNLYVTHGHDLRWGNAGGRRGTGQMGIKGRKKWDNCNSIFNKIYLKINKVCFNLKKKKKKDQRFQINYKIQENTTEQLVAPGRTV